MRTTAKSQQGHTLAGAIIPKKDTAGWGRKTKQPKEKYCRFYSLNRAECLKIHKPQNILLDFLLKVANS